MGANGQMVNANEQQAEAAERLLGVLEDPHTEWVKGMKVASDWIGSADSVANVRRWPPTSSVCCPNPSQPTTTNWKATAKTPRPTAR